MTIKQFRTLLNSVIWREMRRMVAQPVYSLASVVLMAVSCIFFLTLFDTGAPQKVPIGIVDQDRSSISRRVAHELDATQSVKVINIYATYEEARVAMQQGKIYAFLCIPEHFYGDLAAFKRPTLTFYVNNAYTIGGSTGYKQLFMVMNLASGAFQREVLRKKGMAEHLIMKRIQPVAIDAHLIGNPTSSYPVYLLGVILPGILGLVVLMITIYSIGTELKYKTSRQWLRTANGNFTIAMLGKLMQLFILYAALGVAVNVLLYKFMHFPVNGSMLILNLSLVLYIFAMQSLAVFFIGLMPVLRDALSIGALYGMLSFSLSGFTFPAMGMLPWVQSLTNLFPLRHYYLIYVNEALLGNSITHSLLPMGSLMLFFLTQFFVAPRLHRALWFQNYPKG